MYGLMPHICLMPYIWFDVLYMVLMSCFVLTPVYLRVYLMICSMVCGRWYVFDGMCLMDV